MECKNLTARQASQSRASLSHRPKDILLEQKIEGWLHLDFYSVCSRKQVYPYVAL